jgi:hypothetical protein
MAGWCDGQQRACRLYDGVSGRRGLRREIRDGGHYPIRQLYLSADARVVAAANHAEGLTGQMRDVTRQRLVRIRRVERAELR